MKEEDRGRVFPASDKASTVVQALVSQVYRLGVEVWQDTAVSGLVARDERIVGVQLADGRLIRTRAVVVATGGASVPQTGSTGDAYPWARALGHTIIDPYPTEVPLVSHAPVIQAKRLQGLSLRDVVVTLTDGRAKRLTQEEGDVMFSHFGLTGPAALRVSHYVSTALRKNPAEALTAYIDVLPAISGSDILGHLKMGRQKGRKELKTHVLEWVPERLMEEILRTLALDPHQAMAEVGNPVLEAVVKLIKAFPLPIAGTLPLAKATVTGGGVSVKDIQPSTMGSKRCQGLYFAGEVMDVHAHTGGYNITVAFSTGHLAGQSAAEYSLKLSWAPVPD
nr:aminoacetone oxidase family FAD-binding enzyme [Sulfobacillus harzensis]